MESILIIVIGLIFSVLSKSVKDKKEIEEERQKRKEQIDKGLQSTSTQTTTSRQAERKRKSLREVFMEELQKAGDGEGDLGDIFRRTLGEDPQKEVQTKELDYQREKADDEYLDSSPMSIDDRYMNEEEYREALDAKIAAYMDSPTFENETQPDTNISQREINDGKSQVKAGILESKRKEKIKDNRQYNPFTNSLNRKDVIRGIIFSEVLDKPKSLKK